jgi:hypothetical protein
MTSMMRLLGTVIGSPAIPTRERRLAPTGRSLTITCRASTDDERQAPFLKSIGEERSIQPAPHVDSESRRPAKYEAAACVSVLDQLEPSDSTTQMLASASFVTECSMVPRPL